MDGKILFTQEDITNVQDNLFNENRLKVIEAFSKELAESEQYLMLQRKRIEEIEKDIVIDTENLNKLKERFRNGSYAEDVLTNKTNMHGAARRAKQLDERYGSNIFTGGV